MEIHVNVILEVDDPALRSVGRTTRLTRRQKAAVADAEASVRRALGQHLGAGVKVAFVGANPPPLPV